MEENCCSCGWAKWELTKHHPPRPNLYKYGTCQYPVERILVPACYWHKPSEINKYVIWFKNPQTNCAVWEQKIVQVV